jgi:hypothetical protein
MREVLHIGGNKTASTLLQRQLFLRHPRIAYLGEECAVSSAAQAVLEILVHEDDSFYDAAEANRIFSHARNATTASLLVFSNEDLMGGRHPTTGARRLASLMPDATVVMVVRNQLTALESWYANHGAFLKGVPRRYWRRHVGLEEWLDYCFAFPFQTPIESLNYARYFDIYAQLFGSSKIRVLTYEMLLADPPAYFRAWADVLELSDDDVAAHLNGKRERARNSARRHALNKWTSHAPRLQRVAEMLVGDWIDSGPGVRITLPEAWKSRIAERYAEGNRRFAAAAHLDLAGLGYPI